MDFPAPFPPITVTKSPSYNFKSTPLMAFFSVIVPLLNVLYISFNSRINYPFLLGLNILLAFLLSTGTESAIATIIAVRSFKSVAFKPN